uniref:Putative secreted peptide n=1 Tax=Rhipicephalus pulchellus TaxID=72859 RepID=L7M8T5_RHIPC
MVVVTSAEQLVSIISSGWALLVSAVNRNVMSWQRRVFSFGTVPRMPMRLSSALNRASCRSLLHLAKELSVSKQQWATNLSGDSICRLNKLPTTSFRTRAANASWMIGHIAFVCEAFRAASDIAYKTVNPSRVSFCGSSPPNKSTNSWSTNEFSSCFISQAHPSSSRSCASWNRTAMSVRFT